MLANQKSSHIDEVERAIGGAQTARDPLVLESWKRCVDRHGLDPARRCEAYIVPDAELREHQERLEELICTARFGLEALHGQVAGLGYVLLLADAEGITVDFIGDPTFDNQLRKAGLYLGANWKEEIAGTCAVGSCLATREALIVHQTDHFDTTHVPLTCTAAPIHNFNGRIAAVLDISALRSPQAKESQYLALQLVNSYIHRIELANLMNAFRCEWIIQFNQSHEFLGVEPSSAVALNASGEIAGFTSAAQRILAQQTGTDWRQPDLLLGRRFDEFFEFDAEHLGELTRATPAQERLITTKRGDALFAHAIAPQQTPLRKIPEKSLPNSLEQLAGNDKVMRNLLKKAGRLADSRISLLLQGETGTGKEMLARAIHVSRRIRGNFIAVNCAAIPASLIESELFGYFPGAFTGALRKGKKGLIQHADGGTLFLDEIGDMPIELQARLLRVLSEKEVLPIGSNKPVTVNLRVISATHEDLPELIQHGRFREDLFYRLNGAILNIPALRQRRDIDWLINRLIEKNPENTKPVHLNSHARSLLHSYDWPGNIRELLNTLNYAVAVCESGTIGVYDLPEYILPQDAIDKPASGTGSATDEEAIVLAKTLTAHRWNITATARFLGIDRTTVHRRMKRLGLVSPNKRQ
ncbi:MAG: sigma-54-dependent Fis family transcriptional regulator [Gammaproteobacteria bacterium]|nr:sigma-54-dependent Fis family transcriptional regulator [Gammaproteobacteria bacterium]